MLPQHNSHLTPQDREALRMAYALQERMGQWMTDRSVTSAPPRISPFVDASGEPAVLVQINPYLLETMLRSFDQQRQLAHPAQPSPPIPAPAPGLTSR